MTALRERGLPATSSALAFTRPKASNFSGVGGAQTMRGYPTGETSGDQGWRINASITHTLGNTGGWQWRTSAFADHGYIEKQHTPQAGSTTLNAYHLTSVGLGLSAQHNNGLRASLTIGHKLGSNPAANQTTGADADGRLSTDRVWLELGYTF
jgi:hemolysin activation/secretion protein